MQLEEGAKKKQSAPPKRSTTADDEALARAIAAAEEDDAPQRHKGKQGKGSSQSSGKNLKRHVSDAYDVYNHESDEVRAHTSHSIAYAHRTYSGLHRTGVEGPDESHV